MKKLTLLFLFIASFAIGQDLPITLVSFESYETQDKVVVEWETATETNNDKFQLFANNNLIKEVISRPYIYKETFDRDLFKESNVVFKLRQIDFDGSFEDFFTSIQLKEPLIGMTKIRYYNYMGQLLYETIDNKIDQCSRCIVTYNNNVLKF